MLYHTFVVMGYSILYAGIVLLKTDALSLSRYFFFLKATLGVGCEEKLQGLSMLWGGKDAVNER